MSVLLAVRAESGDEEAAMAEVMLSLLFALGDEAEDDEDEETVTAE